MKFDLFHLQKEHLMLRKMAQSFAANEVKPIAQEIDELE